MAESYTKTAVTTKPEWRTIHAGDDHLLSGLLAGTNAAGTGFGLVQAGTILARLANGKLRPAVNVTMAVNAAVNVLDCAAIAGNEGGAANVYVSDVVSIYDGVTGAAIASARNVTAVDKTSSPNTITIDGAAVTTAAGDVLVLDDGNGQPEGVLEDQIRTTVFNEADGSTTNPDQVVTFGTVGHAAQSKLIGRSGALVRALSLGLYSLPIAAASWASSSGTETGTFIRTDPNF